MPYKSIEDLPSPVKSALPLEAQKIYLAAFNHAWDEYKDPQKRSKHEESREQITHKVAWAAVKKKYMKGGDTWQKK